MTAPLALIVAVVLAAPATLQDPDPQSEFEELVDGFIAFHLYFNPVRASLAGERDYDSRLPDVSRAALQARAEGYQLWLDRLASIDEEGLSGDAIDDHVLLEHAIRAELLELVEARKWERDPASYVDILAAGVAILVEDTGIPARDRMNALASRLRQAATLLAAARTNLAGGAPDLIAEQAIRGAERLEAYLESQVAAAFDTVPPGPGKGAFLLSVSQAAAQVADYRAFLASELDRGGDFRLGSDRIGWILRYREHVDDSPEDVLAMLAAEIDVERDRLERRAADLEGPRREGEPVTLSDEGGPQPDAARDLMTAARTHVFRSLFVTIPSDERPSVDSRPPVFAWDEPGVWGPGPLQPDDGPATLYLLATEGSEPPSAAEVSAALLEEAFPGRFVAQLYARRAPTRLRKVVGPSAIQGGWSSYAAAALLESGFEAGEALLVAHTQRRLLALTEARAAIRLHTTGLSVEDAAAEIARDALVRATVARSSVMRAAHRPLAGGILGSLQLRALREDVLRTVDDEEERAARRFHDAFLASGLPPARARRLLLPTKPRRP